MMHIYISIYTHSGGGDASGAGSSSEAAASPSPSANKQSKPSSAIEQAMQATLASIELPPPPSALQPAQPEKVQESESR